MADHSDPNMRRGGSVSGRGILLALVVVLGVLVLLASVGTLGDARDGTAVPASDVIAPAADPAPVATD